jgi:hypothetical protein
VAEKTHIQVSFIVKSEELPPQGIHHNINVTLEVDVNRGIVVRGSLPDTNTPVEGRGIILEERGSHLSEAVLNWLLLATGKNFLYYVPEYKKRERGEDHQKQKFGSFHWRGIRRHV